LFYYSKENSTLEIDFFVQKETQIIPIEVKAELNVKSKSLSTILQNNEEMFGVRFSMNQYRQQEKIVNLPLYCAEVYFKED
jgi:predicted AAA+ superfamily ATPase